MSAQTFSPSSGAALRPRIDLKKLLWVGPLAVVAAIVANLLARALLFAVLDLPTDFPPLQPGAIAFLTGIGVILAVVVFALVGKLAPNPIRTYHAIAFVAMILSILPNLLLMVNPNAIPFPFPGASGLAFGVLILFHGIAYAVAVVILTRLARS